MTVLGLTCLPFIQALVDFGFVRGRKPSSKSHLLARLNQRIDADHRHLRGLPLTFCVLTLLAYLIPIEISVEARGIVRPQDGPRRIIAGAGGRVSKLYFHEGSLVHRGDILVQLDTRDLLLKKAALERRIHFAELRLGERSANTASIRTALSSLYREVEQARLDLNRLTITSPADAKIISLASLQPGELVSPGAAIAALAPGSNPLLIESWLASSERVWVTAGQTVRLQGDADLPDQYNGLEGKVDFISPDARFIGVNRVLITPASDSLELRPGMTFQVHFIKRQERLLWLFFQKIHSDLGLTSLHRSRMEKESCEKNHPTLA